MFAGFTRLIDQIQTDKKKNTVLPRLRVFFLHLHAFSFQFSTSRLSATVDIHHDLLLFIFTDQLQTDRQAKGMKITTSHRKRHSLLHLHREKDRRDRRLSFQMQTVHLSLLRRLRHLLSAEARLRQQKDLCLRVRVEETCVLRGRCRRVRVSPFLPSYRRYSPSSPQGQ